ncbi:MAG: bifunctional methionine sulfoxide reductase B/A protein [Bacteroidetes bacterium]|nr:bifunctional methionine sulfoxide reductase B/A protein [Bacteroidota bacterium]
MSNLKMGIIFYVFFVILSACGQTKPAKQTKPISNNMENFEQTDSFWKAKLSDEQYYILREKGTERPYTGKLLMNKEKGVYKCAACGNELFTSDMKFDSHCGWPSFDREIAGGKIKTETDFSAGMKRTEIMCAKCGGHLGHIFDDGPTETGQRYCVNSVSLEFLSEDELATETNTGNDTIILGGGCFWCVEAIYQNLEGVISVSSGYAGGTVKNPTYKAVCSGTTGHAEVIEIVFDKAKTSLDEIFKVFFVVHDPTTLNRQGADAGTQYRSTIMYRNENQRTIAKSLIDQLEKEKVYDNPIVTTLEPLSVYYKAEDYHQDYFNNNKSQGYCQMVIQPKIDKFEKIFKDRLKKKN